MSIIYNGIGSILIAMLDFWLKKKAHDREMIESYYEFLKQVDKSGAAKVANYLSAESALKKKQEEMRERNDRH